MQIFQAEPYSEGYIFSPFSIKNPFLNKKSTIYLLFRHSLKSLFAAAGCNNLPVAAGRNAHGAVENPAGLRHIIQDNSHLACGQS
ncbi:hypothetical protein J2Z49_000456 [Desulfofundulus luciae]|uniref:Uncharacterized protein n=1 Tax=Desulfofundulus luciae TaxID=74702 RepID=A0ABU0AYM7_9FIRM|nr:hypothetical protein [Desulfofundulus luciae]MDQ0285363.1 hypothetical protein [Desulfofundulus luciae]